MLSELVMTSISDNRFYYWLILLHLITQIHLTTALTEYQNINVFTKQKAEHNDRYLSGKQEKLQNNPHHLNSSEECQTLNERT